MKNELFPPRCEICKHWSKEHNWLGNYEIEECTKIKEFVAAGADWFLNEISVETPGDFYCAKFSPKNPGISKEDYLKIIGGNIKHDDD